MDVSSSTESKRSKRPADTKFKQQKLPAWKPILTPKTVLPNVAVVGVVFIAVGIALYLGSNSVGTGSPCADLLEDFSNGFTNHSEDIRCKCELQVDLTAGFGNSDVFLYYELDNFYQNHRAYVSSRWDAQLRAITTKAGSDCSPLDQDKNGNTYAPCGIVANSLFN
eukprot:gene4539-8563_t